MRSAAVIETIAPLEAAPAAGALGASCGGAYAGAAWRIGAALRGAMPLSNRAPLLPALRSAKLRERASRRRRCVRCKHPESRGVDSTSDTEVPRMRTDERSCPVVLSCHLCNPGRGGVSASTAAN